ncbi:MAG: DNA polymerase III subunit delta' [Candidatus Nitricoxidivorans perseverans]|uniref:DNA polymerase III subunit delta n=1 Tax=Candidatus Nitricoxidivorans perseverans TaxID=2975601 RepID=A0AA49FLL0_9PROT|nr:MAG: DNA polymerase III subunit delta' [Candidatus Nitricoxidivorans perseverans]
MNLKKSLQVSVDKVYSWNAPLWRQLWDAGSGPPHALLLAGPPGVGKSVFADALAERLLCENRSGDTACGACPSCHWLAGGNHPDFRRVIPEADAEDTAETEAGSSKKKASTQIRIDQIRELEDFVYMGGHRNRGRVILVEPADAMNPAAANSLLKILEEPPATVYFILITQKWRRLLPTIRSRCRLLMFPRPSLEVAQKWLEGQGAADAAQLLPMMGGAPLRALNEVERGRAPLWNGLADILANPGTDPLALATRWESQIKNGDGLTMEDLVAVIQKWVFDLAHGRMAGKRRFFAGTKMEEAAWTKIPGLIRCYDEILRVRALASHPLNAKLFLEDIAARYLRALAT